jgi:hypothetical protein
VIFNGGNYGFNKNGTLNNPPNGLTDKKISDFHIEKQLNLPEGSIRTTMPPANKLTALPGKVWDTHQLSKGLGKWATLGALASAAAVGGYEVWRTSQPSYKTEQAIANLPQQLPPQRQQQQPMPPPPMMAQQQQPYQR